MKSAGYAHHLYGVSLVLVRNAVQKNIILVWIVFSFVSLRGQNDVFCGKARATYYANKFEGRKCSSGEVFHQDGFTAAHRSLKFGTKVKVTNLKNDSSVIVTVNDRMPRREDCHIDLTLAAAKRLNFVKAGVAKVRIEILKDSVP